jgi:hypothetical protein
MLVAGTAQIGVVEEDGGAAVLGGGALRLAGEERGDALQLRTPNSTAGPRRLEAARVEAAIGAQNAETWGQLCSLTSFVRNRQEARWKDDYEKLELREKLGLLGKRCEKIWAGLKFCGCVATGRYRCRFPADANYRDWREVGPIENLGALHKVENGPDGTGPTERRGGPRLVDVRSQRAMRERACCSYYSPDIVTRLTT